MGKTGIEWTDETWNPTKGCREVSPGCKNCYAKEQAARIVRMAKGKPTKYDTLVKIGPRGDSCWTGKGLFDPEALAIPLKRRAPTRFFVDSMSDLFFEAFTNEQIAAVFGVMAACPQHTFQVLTKRPKRMREWFAWVETEAARERDAAVVRYEDTRDMQVRLCVAWMDTHHVDRRHVAYPPWPLPNVWLGVSAENQATYIERVHELHGVPAAVHFISAEPLLGAIDMSADSINPAWLDWVIAGCESGPGARPCEVEWLRSLVRQCRDAGVLVFVKQAVEEADTTRAVYPSAQADRVVVPGAIKVGPGSHRKANGVIGAPYLDGEQWLQFPEVPRG